MTPERTNPGPESIVVSLENAKKLKEAGWPQESTFWWVHHLPLGMWELFYQRDDDDRVNEHTAAPSAEEILRRLPRVVNCMVLEIIVARNSETGESFYQVTYPCLALYGGQRLADAAAAMWCYLAQHGLLPKP